MAPAAPREPRAPLPTVLGLIQISLVVRLFLDVVGLAGATLAIDLAVIGPAALASMPSLALLVIALVAPRRGWLSARFVSGLLVAILAAQMVEGVVFQAFVRSMPPGLVVRAGRQGVEAASTIVFPRSAFASTLLLSLIPSMLGAWLGGRRAAWRWALLAIALNATGLALADLSDLMLVRFNLGAFGAQSLVIALTTLFVGALADQLRDEQAHLREANLRLAAQSRVGEQLAASRERVRLARDLHDTLAHTLAALDVQLKAVDALIDTDQVRARANLRTAEDVVRQGLREARGAISDLRANLVEEEGVGAALHRQVEQLGARSSAQMTFEQAGPEPSLDRARAEGLARIAQEALTNASRHAQAQRITLRLAVADDEVEVRITDDGVGFDPKSLDDARFGVRGMRERADEIGARLLIESQAGRGTTVTLRLSASLQAVQSEP